MHDAKIMNEVIPELVLKLASQLALIKKETLLNFKINKSRTLIADKNQLDDFVDIVFSGLTLDDGRHIVENAIFMTAILKDEHICLFEYKGWLINIPELMIKNDCYSGIYLRRNSPLMLKVQTLSLALILTEEYDESVMGLLGININSMRWVKKLSKEIPLTEVFLIYIKTALKYPNYNLFKANLKSYKYAEADEMKNESFIATKFIANAIVEAAEKIAGFDDDLKLGFEILISVGKQEDNQIVYWVEFRDYYILASDETIDGVKIGLLKDLKLVAAYKETFMENMFSIGYSGLITAAQELKIANQ